MKRGKNLKHIRSFPSDDESARLRRLRQEIDSEADRLIQDWQNKGSLPFWQIDSDAPPQLGEVLVSRITFKMERRGINRPAIVLNTDTPEGAA